jgi:hypothetical protein
MNESFSYFPYFFYFFLFPFLHFTFFFHFSLFFFPLPSSSSRCVSSFFFSSLLPSSFFLLCRCLAPRARPIHCRPFCPQHIHCCHQPPASATLPRADLHRSCLVLVWTFVHPHYPPTCPRPRHVKLRVAFILAHDAAVSLMNQKGEIKNIGWRGLQLTNHGVVNILVNLFTNHYNLIGV